MKIVASQQPAVKINAVKPPRKSQLAAIFMTISLPYTYTVSILAVVIVGGQSRLTMLAVLVFITPIGCDTRADIVGRQ